MAEQKIVSQLDSEGYFIAEVLADESPLEPGVFLLPAGCADIRGPELQPGECAKLVDGTWQISIDYRGLVYWTTDGNRHVITERGIQPPDGYLTESPGPTAEELIQALKAEALILLSKSDQTIVRCYENNVAVPQLWKDYRADLRAIVSSGSGAIPTRPEYPAGT